MSLRYSFRSKLVVVPVVNYCHSAPNQTFTSPSAPVWRRPVNTWSSVRSPRLTLPVELSLRASNEHPSPGPCRAHGPAALGGIAHSPFLWAASPSTLVKSLSSKLPKHRASLRKASPGPPNGVFPVTSPGTAPQQTSLPSCELCMVTHPREAGTSAWDMKGSRGSSVLSQL